MASGKQAIPGQASVLIVILVAMLILSVPAVLGGPMSGESVEAQSDDDEIITVSIDGEEVEIWERSFLPLQADSEQAETSITAPTLSVEDVDGDTARDIRDDIPVFGTDSAPVELTEHPRASSADLEEFETENGQAVVAYLDEDVSQEDFTLTDGVGLLPTSISDLEDTLDAENRSKLNENVTFVEEEIEITEEGELAEPVDIADHIDDPFDPGAGHYAVVVSDGEVLDIDEGENELQDISGDGTVVGVERVAVHTDELSADIEPSDDLSGVDVDLLTGEDLGVDIATEEIEGNDLVHAVAMYEEDTFVNSEFRLKLNEELNEDLRLENTTLKHDIETVSGVFEIDEDITIGGETLSEDRRDDSFELQSVVDRAFDELDVDDEDRPNLEATDDRTLDASAFLTQGEADQSVTVETRDDFEDGEYQLVAVTTENSTSQSFETTERTVTIKSTPFEIVDFEDVTIDEGDGADISAEIENLGSDTGEQDVSIEITGEGIDTEQTVEIEGGETQEVEFEDVDTGGLDAGNYDIVIETEDDDETATLTIEEDEPPAPDPAEFEITEFEDQSVIEGDTADIDVSIENTGDEDGSTDVELSIAVDDADDILVEESVDLDGGDSTEFTFENVDTAELDDGTYDMTVDTDDDSASAELTVVSEDDVVDELELTLDQTTITTEETTTATVTAIFESADELDVTDESTITSTDADIATVEGAEVEGGADPGVVTIEAEYEDDDGNTFTDEESLEVTPEPTDVDAEEEREDLGISPDVGVGESERNSLVYNPDADESVYQFSGVTSVEQVRVAGNISADDEMTTTRLDETPPELDEPEGELIAASHLAVSEDVQGNSGRMLMNISQDALEDADAESDDLEIVRFNDADEEWEELDSEIVEERDDVVIVEVQVPDFSNFAITADMEEEVPVDDDDDTPGWVVIPLGLLLVVIGFIIYYTLYGNEESDVGEEETSVEEEPEDSEQNGNTES